MLGVSPWAIAILGVAIAGGGAYLKGRADGRAIEVAAQMKVAAAREAKAREDRATTQNHAHQIEDRRNERSAETDHARAVLEPVRVCYDPGTYSRAAAAAAATDSREAADQLPVPTGRTDPPAADMPDIGPGLIALMEACQRDHDDARAWREWWAAISPRSLGSPQ